MRPPPSYHLSLLSPSSFFFFFHLLSGVFINYVPFARNLFAFSLCVWIAGIGMDLFIVVTLAAWSFKAALLSRAKTLARSAYFCLLFKHYLPSGAFKSTSAKHHFHEREKETERGRKRKERRKETECQKNLNKPLKWWVYCFTYLNYNILRLS